MGVLGQILKALLSLLAINKDMLATEQQILSTTQSILQSTQHIEELLEAESIPVPSSIKVTYQHTVN